MGVRLATARPAPAERQAPTHAAARRDPSPPSPAGREGAGARVGSRSAADPDPSPLDHTGLSHLIGYAASRASLEMRKVFTRHMEPLGLRVADYSVLMLVAHNSGIRQKALGRALDIAPPHLAVLLDRLCERGWLLRARDPVDRRAQQIRLTDAGRRLAERAERIAATMEDGALGGLSPGERVLLVELLRKLYPG